MSSILTKDTYDTISIEELHPTFAAEVRGVDFQNLSDTQLAEILAALAKVGKLRISSIPLLMLQVRRLCLPQHGPR